MFVCNVKINKNFFTKVLITTLIVIILIVFVCVALKFRNAITTVKIDDNLPNSALEINANNYASILKDSHDNIDKYVGKSIKFVGFVYRLYDFSENQFVLGREMIISSDNQAVVVGFLCDCSEVNNRNNYKLNDGDWIEIEGVIYKGYYHGDLPVVKLTSIVETDVPNNQYVCPPDAGYVVNEI